jgi:hypothetical protein
MIAIVLEIAVTGTAASVGWVCLIKQALKH